MAYVSVLQCLSGQLKQTVRERDQRMDMEAEDCKKNPKVMPLKQETSYYRGIILVTRRELICKGQKAIMTSDHTHRATYATGWKSSYYTYPNMRQTPRSR